MVPPAIGLPDEAQTTQQFARGRLAQLAPPDWQASRDAPKVTQLEEGVDVVDEHEEQLVVTAERDAERTERRRDSSSQSDLGAVCAWCHTCAAGGSRPVSDHEHHRLACVGFDNGYMGR